MKRAIIKALNEIESQLSGQSAVATYSYMMLCVKALTERLAQAVHDFVGDTEQSDDLTMLAVRFCGKE